MHNIKLMLQYTKVLNVLYVEDDSMLLESTKKVFDNYFKNVDIAVDGQEGLELYIEYHKKNGVYYDLVITDINMPNMDGMAMSEEILNKNDMQAIIITTAYNEIQRLQEAIDIGVFGFITKPIKHENLNKILYKISRTICDRIFVESHITKIEKLNIKLEKQNEELSKSLRMLDTVISKDKTTHSEDKTKTTEIDDEEQKQKIEQLKLLIQDDLYELKEILSEIDVVVIKFINNPQEIDTSSLDELILLFSRYASILSFYTIFDELSIAMSNFSVTLKENPLPEDVENTKNIFMFLETFMYVLDRWHTDLFSGDENKINALDASIINDMHTITNMWTQKEEEADENLDGIFDF
ncbi:MAG: response regulator [Sulfurimonas sp.]|nr:response regulator [Sulfurimonas sp.]